MALSHSDLDYKFYHGITGVFGEATTFRCHDGANFLLSLRCRRLSYLTKVAEFSFSLADWGNKNWPPSMKVEKLENFQDKSGSKGCKWSSLNGPGTETPLHHPILKLEEFPFLIIGPLG